MDHSVIVIFGATGDLAVHYLIPALLHLETAGLLPEDLHVTLVSRRPWNTEEYIQWLLPQISIQSAVWKRFAKRLSYVQAEFDKPASFGHLAKFLGDVDGEVHACFNRLFYFAVEPKFFEPLSKVLQKSGLLSACKTHGRTTRVLIEKPFGNDLKSALKLNKLLTSFFKEEQIYRIDHYLGKETVQNLLVARFANNLFEPIWNKKYIERVEIDALESEGVGNRIEFYNQTGTLKDVVQNHLLNILALLAMEQPKSLSAAHIRAEKVKVLERLVPETAKTITKHAIRAQYTASGDTKGFIQEGGNTSVETFVALKIFVNTSRFLGVPFVLKAGKRLPEKRAEIRIVFKPAANNLFKGQPNILRFQIQPVEQVGVSVNTKIPGFGMELHPAELDFTYKQFKRAIPTAYERLLLDFIQNDQRLFLASKEVEASWKYIDSVAKYWQKLPMQSYMPFSEGPDITRLI